jgi:non-specific serine/threonine protein kinase
VFAGGWKLEAAEAVCAGEGIEEWEVLDLLTSLVEKSLVVYDEQRGEARYRLLETVRQHARDRLLGTSETETLRDRHLAFFLHWVEIGQERLESARPAEWFDHLEGEHDNLRTALDWSLTVEGSADTALRLAIAMEQFWMKGRYAGEGREWLTRALVRDGRVPAASRARALRAAGRLADGQGDYAAARSLFEQSLTLAQGLGDSSNTAYALHGLAFTAFCQAEYEQAKALAEEALAILRELGNRQGVADALMLLGYVARGQGDTAAERSHYEQALALRRELGVKWGIAHSLHNLGHVARSEGNYEVARLHYIESLAGFQELTDTLDIAKVLEGFAALAAAEGKLRRSARLWGAADALHEALSLPMPPVDHITYDPYIEAVRTALGEEAFAAAWAEGRAMTTDEAIRYAVAAEGKGGASA